MQCIAVQKPDPKLNALHCAAIHCTALQYIATRCNAAQRSKIPVRKLVADGTVTVMVNYGLNLTDGTSAVQLMSVLMQFCELH